MKLEFKQQIVACLLLVSAAATPALSQDGSAGGLRTARKPATSVKSSAAPLPKGDTFVSLAPGLERVSRGYEPRTLDTLRLLEKQQAKVVDSIEKVTVNVQQGMAQGSGVIISPSGYIFTAAHVAGRPGLKAKVVFSDGRTYQAETLGMNRNIDAGLMKITTQRDEPWPFATLGSKSTALREGQWCVAAGHPGGFETGRGAVIRVGRILRVLKGGKERKPHTLLTDCALIGGDSGGPLFGLDGRLVGVHSRIGSSITENMHVPIDAFEEGWDRMVLGEVWGTLPGYRPVIGVKGAADETRALIDSVDSNGPAHSAGLTAGDIVIAVDKREIKNFADLQAAVRRALPGDVLAMTILRNNQKLRIHVPVAAAE